MTSFSGLQIRVQGWGRGRGRGGGIYEWACVGFVLVVVVVRAWFWRGGASPDAEESVNFGWIAIVQSAVVDYCILCFIGVRMGVMRMGGLFGRVPMVMWMWILGVRKKVTRCVVGIHARE